MTQKTLLREKKFLWAPFWGVLFALVIIAGSGFLVGKRSMHRLYDYDFNGDLLLEFAEKAEETDISIVMLGNSRMRNATAMGYDPNEIYKLPDGRTATIVQFAANAARFVNYNSLTLEIMATRPDVLVIQDGVITNAMVKRFDIKDFSRGVTEYYKNQINGLTFFEEWHKWRNTPIGCPDVDYARPHMEGYLKYMDNFQHIPSDLNPGYIDAQNFLRNIMMLGTKVVVLHLDPQVEFFEKYDVPLHESNFHGLGYDATREEIVNYKTDDVIWLSYRETKPENFCDFVHLNDLGAVGFSNWLLEEISRIDLSAKPKGK